MKMEARQGQNQAESRGRRLESESNKQCGSGQAENNQKQENSPRSKRYKAKTGNNAQKRQPVQIETSQGCGVCEWLLCVCINEVQV